MVGRFQHRPGRNRTSTIPGRLGGRHHGPATPKRQALRAQLSDRLHDVFRLLRAQNGRALELWDYRACAWDRDPGLGGSITSTSRRSDRLRHRLCHRQSGPRKHPTHDHAPVVVNLCSGQKKTSMTDYIKVRSPRINRWSLRKTGMNGKGSWAQNTFHSFRDPSAPTHPCRCQAGGPPSRFAQCAGWGTFAGVARRFGSKCPGAPVLHGGPDPRAEHPSNSSACRAEPRAHPVMPAAASNAQTQNVGSQFSWTRSNTPGLLAS